MIMFVLNFQVIDLSAKLHEIYQLIDPVMLEMLVSDVSKCLSSVNIFDIVVMLVSVLL